MRAAILRWWRGRLARSAGLLLASNLMASVLGLASFALVARALGASGFGAFAMIIAYAFVVDTLANFQSWQAIIKYGAHDLQRSDAAAFSQLVKFGTLLDVCCAAASTVLAAALALLLAPYLGFETDALAPLLSYTAIILFRATGTPTAVLRLFDHFEVIAVIQVAQAIARLAGVAALYAVGPSLPTFLLVWGITEVAGNLATIGFGWRQLRARGYRSAMSADLRGLRALHAGIWSFVWTTNLQNSLKLGLREADVLALGVMAGQHTAGLYKIVKQTEAICTKALGPLTQVIYPRLASSAAAGDIAVLVRMVRMSSAAAAIVFGAAICGFWLWGEGAIRWLLGAQFAPAYQAALIYLIGTFIAAVTFSLPPAVLSLGLPRQSLRILLVSTILYVVAFGVLVQHYQLIGAALAYVSFYAIWALLTVRMFGRAVAKPQHSRVAEN